MNISHFVFPSILLLAILLHGYLSISDYFFKNKGDVDHFQIEDKHDNSLSFENLHKAA